MKCRFSYLFAFALLVCLFTPAFFTSGDSLAVSDTSMTISSSNIPSLYDTLCSDFYPYVPNCSDYDYLIVDFSGTGFSSDTSFTFAINPGGVNIAFYPYLGTRQIFTNFSFTEFQFYTRNNSNGFLTGGGTVTFTLTNDSPIGGSSPSGSLSITENGTYDVSSYAEAVVNVPSEVIPGDYHDDLQDLKQVALLVPAVLLLIYFFWAIYKMIMGGVKR